MRFRELLAGLTLGLALIVSGCAADLPKAGDVAVAADAAPVDKGDQFLSEIGEFTLNDLNVAMDLTGDFDRDGKIDAGVVNGDMLADQCWFFLAEKVKATSADTGGKLITVAGVISGFQSARNVKRRLTSGGAGGLSDEFYAACGGLISDVRGDILKLGVKGSLGLVPGGGLIGGVLGKAGNLLP